MFSMVYIMAKCKMSMIVSLGLYYEVLLYCSSHLSLIAPTTEAGMKLRVRGKGDYKKG